MSNHGCFEQYCVQNDGYARVSISNNVAWGRNDHGRHRQAVFGCRNMKVLLAGPEFQLSTRRPMSAWLALRRTDGEGGWDVTLCHFEGGLLYWLLERARLGRAGLWGAW